VHGNIYVGPPTRDPTKALAIYLGLQVETCRHVSLRGLDVGASDPTGTQLRFDLAQVYVDLLTTTQVPLDRTAKRHTQQVLPTVAKPVRLACWRLSLTIVAWCFWGILVPASPRS
jgi:hypothetical protein